MVFDAYESFADRYDLFYDKLEDIDPFAASFYRKLFEDNRVQSVLDCACGTGRDLVLFHSLGSDVAGSDVSEAMLNQAQKNLSKLGANVPLEKADYRELPQHFNRKFDAVMCLSTAIGEMPDETEVIRAFRSMYKVLNRGGILVLTQGTTDKQWAEKPRFIPMVNTKDFSRICVIDYQDRGARYNILDIFHSNKITDFKVWSIDYLQILLRNDFDRLLKTAGFKTVEFYGNYNFDNYDVKSSIHLIVIAHS